MSVDEQTCMTEYKGECTGKSINESFVRWCTRDIMNNYIDESVNENKDEYINESIKDSIYGSINEYI